jgi:SWI/SNF-related matrix-associated actin-dependent regulator of chromatin subfamily A member 5
VKCVNHPYNFIDCEPKGLPEFGDHIRLASGKLIVTDKLIQKAIKENSQVLLFSQYTTTLDIIEDYFHFKKYKYVRLDGNTDLEDREDYVESFTAQNSDLRIFLISTKAGGLGLNLMTANMVILYDSCWNPQTDLQAIDRAHRIGQTRPVSIFRLVTNHTFEEKIIERQMIRLKLEEMVI